MREVRTPRKQYRRTPKRPDETAVVRAVLRWYASCGRNLPWRNITDPYRVLISEIMLQQTQVSRVLVKYPQFLKRFPTLPVLASATRRSVIMQWRGMGYNNRAVRLHALAKAVMRMHGGLIPREYDALVSLPGIGRYTANALLSSAWRERVPVVDVNVRRVLSRIFRPMKTTAALLPEHDTWKLAAALLPSKRTYDWNQALMDLGAMLCTARSPRCAECPVGTLCASRPAMKRASRMQHKQEPSRDGIPHRIYRGRIIETLRRARGRTLPLTLVGKSIHRNYSLRHQPWLTALISGLERDGLVKWSKHKGSARVTLG